MKYALFLILLATQISCQTSELSSSNAQFEGEWIFKGYEVNDIITPPCMPEGGEVTLLIKEKGDVFSIEGKSFVNSYFSKAQIGKEANSLTVGAVGTTKMAGPDHLMACESRYYELLRSVFSYKTEGSELFLSTSDTSFAGNTTVRLYYIQK